jgi:hypothetical protein
MDEGMADGRPRRPGKTSASPAVLPAAGDADAVASDRAIAALMESEQLSDGAQLILATALVDALQGRNEYHRFANLRNPQDAAMLAFLEKNAPPMIAQYATAKLHAMGNQRNAVDVLAEALRGTRSEAGPKKFFSKLLGR